MNSDSQRLAERLAAGAARGLGCANAVACEALQSPEKRAQLVAALHDKRSVVRIRAANALKKISEADPALLAPFGRELLQLAGECNDLQMRWNLIVVIGGLPLRGKDKALAIELLFEALSSDSGFLRAFALSGLVNLVGEDEGLRKRVQPIVQSSLEDTSAAVRARARKLLEALRVSRHTA